MVSRKKAAGKARKKAKAKAREAAEEERNNHQMNEELEQSLAAQASPYLTAPTPAPLVQSTSCRHGAADLSSDSIYFAFVTAYDKSFYEATRDVNRSLSSCLETARYATMDEFAEVWNDSSKMKVAVSSFLGLGTHDILVGKYDHARKIAAIARYLEQYIAIVLKHNQNPFNFPKLRELYYSDLHTLVKFFRHRIPCSCLDDAYEEVKSITKMGFCYNPVCKYPKRRVGRSKTMYCSRCRCATYCSRECQAADWLRHKSSCDTSASLIAKLEAELQNV